MYDIPDGPIAWVNGQFVPSDEAALPLTDLALHGVAVTEMIRTYDHELFRLDAHLMRLSESVTQTALDAPAVPLAEICRQVARRNCSFLRSESDLGLIILVSAGTNPTYTGTRSEPTVAVHSFELPLARWSGPIQDGVHLVTSAIRQLPQVCVPATAKTRNRLHWHLATQEVRRRDPNGLPILLNQHGELTETPSANFFAVYGEWVVTPDQDVLPGVSRDVIRELCPGLGLTCEERAITPDQIASADEAFLSSTPFGLMPVTQFDSADVGDGRPGPIFFELCNALSEMVGIDILDQLLAARE